MENKEGAEVNHNYNSEFDFEKLFDPEPTTTDPLSSTAEYSENHVQTSRNNTQIPLINGHSVTNGLGLVIENKELLELADYVSRSEYNEVKLKMFSYLKDSIKFEEKVSQMMEALSSMKKDRDSYKEKLEQTERELGNANNAQQQLMYENYQLKELKLQRDVDREKIADLEKQISNNIRANKSQLKTIQKLKDQLANLKKSKRQNLKNGESEHGCNSEITVEFQNNENSYFTENEHGDSIADREVNNTFSQNADVPSPFTPTTTIFTSVAPSNVSTIARPIPTHFFQKTLQDILEDPLLSGITAGLQQKLRVSGIANGVLGITEEMVKQPRAGSGVFAPMLPMAKTPPPMLPPKKSSDVRRRPLGVPFRSRISEETPPHIPADDRSLNDGGILNNYRSWKEGRSLNDDRSLSNYRSSNNDRSWNEERSMNNYRNLNDNRSLNDYRSSNKNRSLNNDRRLNDNRSLNNDKSLKLHYKRQNNGLIKLNFDAPKEFVMTVGCGAEHEVNFTIPPDDDELPIEEISRIMTSSKSISVKNKPGINAFPTKKQKIHHEGITSPSRVTSHDVDNFFIRTSRQTPVSSKKRSPFNNDKISCCSSPLDRTLCITDTSSVNPPFALSCDTERPGNDKGSPFETAPVTSSWNKQEVTRLDNKKSTPFANQDSFSNPAENSVINKNLSGLHNGFREVALTPNENKMSRSSSNKYECAEMSFTVMESDKLPFFDPVPTIPLHSTVFEEKTVEDQRKNGKDDKFSEDLSLKKINNSIQFSPSSPDPVNEKHEFFSVPFLKYAEDSSACLSPEVYNSNFTETVPNQNNAIATRVENNSTHSNEVAKEPSFLMTHKTQLKSSSIQQKNSKPERENGFNPFPSSAEDSKVELSTSNNMKIDDIVHLKQQNCKTVIQNGFKSYFSSSKDSDVELSSSNMEIDDTVLKHPDTESETKDVSTNFEKIETSDNPLPGTTYKTIAKSPLSKTKTSKSYKHNNSPCDENSIIPLKSASDTSTETMEPNPLINHSKIKDVSTSSKVAKVTKQHSTRIQTKHSSIEKEINKSCQENEDFRFPLLYSAEDSGISAESASSSKVQMNDAAHMLAVVTKQPSNTIQTKCMSIEKEINKSCKESENFSVPLSSYTEDSEISVDSASSSNSKMNDGAHISAEVTKQPSTRIRTKSSSIEREPKKTCKENGQFNVPLPSHIEDSGISVEVTKQPSTRIRTKSMSIEKEINKSCKENENFSVPLSSCAEDSGSSAFSASSSNLKQNEAAFIPAEDDMHLSKRVRTKSLSMEKEINKPCKTNEPFSFPLPSCTENSVFLAESVHKHPCSKIRSEDVSSNSKVTEIGGMISPRTTRRTQRKSLSVEREATTPRKDTANCCIAIVADKICEEDSDEDSRLVIAEEVEEPQPEPDISLHDAKKSPFEKIKVCQRQKKKSVSPRIRQTRQSANINKVISDGNSVKAAFQELEKLKFTDAHYKKTTHTLYGALIDPKKSLKHVILYIVEFLGKSRSNPFASEKDICFLPLAERCIVEVLFMIENKSKLFLRNLIESTIETLFHMASTKFNEFEMLGTAAVCRVLTEICKKKGNRQVPLKLCGELVKYEIPCVSFLVASIVGLWPEAFQVTTDLPDDELTVYLRSLAMGYTKKPLRTQPTIAQNIWKRCQNVLSTHIPVKAYDDKTIKSVLEFLKERIRNKCIERHYENDYLLSTPLVIFCRFKGHNWANLVVLKFISDFMNKCFFNGELEKELGFEYCLNLHAEIVARFPKQQDVYKIPKQYFCTATEDAGFQRITSAVAVLKISLWRLNELFDDPEISSWLAQHSSHKKLQEASHYFIRRLMSTLPLELEQIILT